MIEILPGKSPAGAPQVTAHLATVSAHDIVEGIGRIALTPREAFDLGARLIKAATEAEHESRIGNRDARET